MSLHTACAVILALGAAPALAQTAAPSSADAPSDVRAVYEALLLPQAIDVMVREGLDYGDVLAVSIFGEGAAPEQWSNAVAAIYDRDHLTNEVLDSLAENLSGEDTTAMLAFLESEPGRSLMAFEIAAREAMLDDEVEQEATEAAAVAMADDAPRIDLLRRYAEVNDLIETNVVGAMNTNYAYFMGLMDGGALSPDMTESDVLSDVWTQEPQIRADTIEWVYSFLLKAYEPATDGDIEALIDFSETEPGQALNRAVFEAFDDRFVEVSRALGLVAARYMTTEQL